MGKWGNDDSKDRWQPKILSGCLDVEISSSLMRIIRIKRNCLFKWESTGIEKHMLRKYVGTGQWCHAPLIPGLRRQQQADLCEFKAILIYKVHFRTARTVWQRNPVCWGMTDSSEVKHAYCSCGGSNSSQHSYQLHKPLVIPSDTCDLHGHFYTCTYTQINTQ